MPRPGPLLPALLLVLAAVSAGEILGAEGRLSTAEAREIGELLQRFRTTRGDAEARAEVVDRLFEIGGPAVGRLFALVRAEARPLQARYAAAYRRAALAAVRSKLKAASPRQIEALRETIRGVIASPTKDAITGTADPALEKLTGMLVVSRQEVLAARPALASLRERLVGLGKVWQRAADHLAESGPSRPGADPPPRFRALLVAEEERAALALLAEDEAARAVLETNARLESRLDPEEAAGLRHLNRLRLLVGLGALRIDPRLADAARDHSKDMVEKGFFSHDSPVAGKATFSERAKRFGTTARAENIAHGADTGRAVIMQWWHSPGHLKNMMGSHRRTGLGRHERHWTQLFGG